MQFTIHYSTTIQFTFLNYIQFIIHFKFNTYSQTYSIHYSI